jgi:two-component system, sensor histidine kinase and response regulator
LKVQSDQREDYVQLLIERMPVALIVWDIQFRVQFWNPAAENMLGFKKEEALGKKAEELLLPQDALPHAAAIWRRLLDGDTNANNISQCLTKNGCRIVCLWTNTPLKNADGQVFGVLSMLQDITEPQRSSEALGKSERELRSFFIQSQDGMVLVDSRGSVIEWNNALEKLTGYKSAEALGKSLWYMQCALMPDNLKNAEVFEKVRQMDREVLQTRQGPWLNCLSEYEIQRIDGERRTVQSKFFLIDLGKDFMLGVILHDVTEYKKALASLEDSEKKYRSLVNSARLGIFRSTPEGRHLEVNKTMEHITGYSRQELLSLDIRDLYLHPEERKAILERVDAAPDEAMHEIRNRKKDGQQIIVAATISPVRDTEGKVMYFDGVLEDITERKRLEDQIKELYKKEKTGRQQSEEEAKTRGVFVDVLGHELRTPLTPILASIGLLKDTLEHEQSTLQGKLINNISESAEILAQRLDELLELGRFYHGDIKLKLQTLDMSKFITGTTSRFSLIRKKNQKLILDLAEKLPSVEGDALRLTQVLKVLLANAARFSPEESTITVRTRQEKARVLVEVQDEGISLSPEEQARLFQPYHRVVQDRHEYQGISLGLAIARQIIERHGGTLRVTGLSGLGNMFSFTLPLEREKKAGG